MSRMRSEQQGDTLRGVARQYSVRQFTVYCAQMRWLGPSVYRIPEAEELGRYRRASCTLSINSRL